MKPLEIILIGAGKAAFNHANAIHEMDGIILKSCYDPDFKTAQSFSENFGITMHNNLEEAISTKENESLVIICTPPNTHTSIALEAIKKSNHILVEKPFCLNVNEIDKVQKTAKEEGVLSAAVAQHRYSDGFSKLRKEIQQLKIDNKIKSINLNIQRFRKKEYFESLQNNWKIDKSQSGGGVLITIGFHYLDLLCNLFAKTEVVEAKITKRTNDIDTSVNGKLSLDNIPCHFNIQWGNYSKKPDQISIETDSGIIGLSSGIFFENNSDQSGSFIHRNILHQRQIEDILKAINHKSPLQSDASSIKKTLSLIFKIYEHAR